MHLMGTKPSPLVCDVIGGADHFFLISAQFWCIILAADISLNISNFLSTAYKSIFLKYCVIVYLSSIVIVITAVVLREKGILDREILFFAVGPNVQVMLQVFPLTLSFFASLAFIIVAIYQIAKTNRQTKIITEQRNNNLTMIALQLTMLCGVPEGIGLINIPNAALNDGAIYVNVVFGMFYSIAKGFRGVVLLILFMCKKLVNRKTEDRQTAIEMKDFD